MNDTAGMGPAGKENPGRRWITGERYLPGDDVVIARQAGGHGCVGYSARRIGVKLKTAKGGAEYSALNDFA